jgi:two-component system response regulator MprA
VKSAAQPTILVVDDDAASGDIVTRILTHEGYRTRSAANGVDCLRIVRAEPVDLILLDVMMPGMDGFQVCAMLRSEHCRVPIILITGKDDTHTRAEGMHLGVTEFLTKPINRGELLARVRAQLHVLDLARQLETVEENLRGPQRRPRSDGSDDR